MHSNNNNESFKKDFDDRLNIVKTKLAKNGEFFSEDMTFLLMASVLEEEAQS